MHLDATSRSEQVFDAIQATAADTAEEIAEMEANERMARRRTPDAADLRRFLEGEVLPWFETCSIS